MSLQTDTVFLNQFQKGSNESANIGMGTLLGVETYSKKGVAQLTKDSIKVSGSVVTDLPVYFTSLTEATIFSQGVTGKVYKSTDYGTTWTDISPNTLTGGGKGLIFYNGYLIAFRNSAIDYLASPYTGGGAWVQGWLTADLIAGNHFPIIFPNDNNIYFGNGFRMGKIGFGTGSTFDPTTPTTGYSYNGKQLTLPNIYQVNCLSYLPTNFLAIGTGSSGIGNSSQIADIILWNPTLSTYETPLPLFSQAGAGGAGVNQIINRNNVLYAVTGGNHAIFSTNGTSFTLLDDISLHTTGRLIPQGVTGKGTGQQSTAPIFLNQFPSAIAIMGNKLMTGVSASINSLPSGYGLFPIGVWSEAFNSDGNALQCEFTISSGIVVSNQILIGAIYPIIQSQLLIGWYDGTNYGIDKTEFQNFQNDSSVVMMESEMMEIGTPLEPAVVTTIQENIVRSLLSGQTVNVYWRTGFDQPYTLLDTFTSSTGNIQLNNSLKTTTNPIGSAKFLQISLDMSTGSPNLAWTPELRNVIVSPK